MFSIIKITNLEDCVDLEVCALLVFSSLDKM